jgi:hypothetical protein
MVKAFTMVTNRKAPANSTRAVRSRRAFALWIEEGSRILAGFALAWSLDAVDIEES